MSTTQIVRQRMKNSGNLCAAILTAALIVSVQSQAGDHWLSRPDVNTLDPLERGAPASEGPALNWSPAVAAASNPKPSSQKEFDLTISLDTNPQGDDNYKTDNGSDDDAQNAFEKRIEEFAKAVYQSTNGTHKIRKVTFFRSTSQTGRVNTADVLWNENCSENDGPRAEPSGYGVSGKHIWMCTHWPLAQKMPTAMGGGYVLAHEWGHYAYGVYDDYAEEQCEQPPDCHPTTPRATDQAAIPSIMNDPWEAASGKEDFLEFSTQNIEPYRSNSSGTNAQKRVFAESAWQTLTRSSNEPKYDWLPDRTQYSSLVAPTDPNWIVRDNVSAALSELDIRWPGNPVLDLSLDRSGSMEGPPLSDAKTGGRLLIDQVQAGTAIGVSSFADEVTRNFKITDIPDPDPDTGVRATAKARVNALVAGGWTSLYDGLMASLSAVTRFDENRTGMVFVLSDGEDNDSSATEPEVISAYQAASIPIIAFAYGDFAPTGTLFRMANATGGAMYASPTTAAQIQAALAAADAKFSANLLLSSAAVAVPSGTTKRSLPLDSTLASARITLSFNGTSGDFVFRLLAPDGTDTGQNFVCEVTTSTSCALALDKTFFAAHGHGDYQLSMRNKTANPASVTVLVSAAPSGTEPYDIEVSFASNTVIYPADMAIRATVTKHVPLAGLEVAAIVTPPLSGSPFEVIMHDTGQGGDEVANDGTYSASIPYNNDGIYTVVVAASNAAGKAYTTYEGISLSPGENGTTFKPASVPITENFLRVGTVTASVSNTDIDDHADDPMSAKCTNVADDNRDTVGRIDTAGDKDCFSVKPSSITNPIVLRVTSLTSEMNPTLTVYDHGGVNQIAQATMQTSENQASGVIVTIPVTKLDASGLVFVVQHTNPAALIGGYAVSAGQAIVSDKPLTEPAPIIIPAPANQIPTADAGLDQTVKLGATVVLDGRASADPDQSPSPLAYQWSMTSGPAANMKGENTATPSMVPSLPGTYTFNLSVSDGAEVSPPDSVTITVEDVPVLLLEPNGGEIWKVRNLQTIRWYASDHLVNKRKPLKLHFTKNGGKKWMLLKRVNVNAGAIQWKSKRAHASERGLIRICVTPTDKKAKRICDISDGSFVILRK